MEDLASKITGNAVTADEWNQMPQELQNLITATSQVLASGNLDQVGAAISVLGMGAAFYTCTGTASAYVLTPLTGLEGPAVLRIGMHVMFRPNVDNDGVAATVAVNGLAATSIKRDDGSTDPQAGDITTEHDVLLRYNGTNFILVQHSASADVNVAFPADHFEGFLHNREAVQDVNVPFGGSCRDIDNTFNIVTTLNRTKRIEETWLEGDDAGGMNDTDHPAVLNQWYRYWVLSKLDGTCDYGWTIDTDTTGANLLADAAVVAAGYVKIQQVGWHLTDGSVNIILYIQNPADPEEIIWDVPIEDVSAVPPTATQASLTVSAPPTSIAKIYLELVSDTGGDVTARGLILPLTVVTDTAPTASIYNMSGKSDSAATEVSGANFEILTDASSQIGSRWDSILGDISIVCNGFKFKRGAV